MEMTHLHPVLLLTEPTCIKTNASMETPILFPISPEEYWQKLSDVMDRLLSEKLNHGSYPGPPAGMTSRPLLSIKKVCNLFQITKPTVYGWTRHGKLKPYKVRARVYFLMADIEALFKIDIPDRGSNARNIGALLSKAAPHFQKSEQ
jgi:predicted DNA-binding transcriptional regulator AlpA